MILIKDGDKRKITDTEVIKVFKEAGWTEVKPKNNKDKED
jgi:hypothetical protein